LLCSEENQNIEKVQDDHHGKWNRSNSNGLVSEENIPFEPKTIDPDDWHARK
jgi:hypothetical protein